MPDCTCHRPGHCPQHDRRVSAVGARIWRGGDARSIQAYFGGAQAEPRPRAIVAGPRGACAYLGGPATDGDGAQKTRVCGPCRGRVREKLFLCEHPAHGEVTLKDCRTCRDFEARGAAAMRETVPDNGTLPVAMVAPHQKRAGVWRGGIIQIHVTRACDLSCCHCTQGSDLAGKPVVMTPEDFERAVDSLEGYWGVFGVFGGNPAISPHFGAYCEILRAKVPFEQRGLWCNHPRGKGTLCRITFNPKVSNLNCHLSGDAHAEFSRDWPEAVPYLKGMDRDSVHGSPWVAMRDVVPDEAERWKLIGDCDVNRHWSALVGVVPGRGLRAYFCELAYAQAALHATASDAEEWPDLGLAAEPGWWRRPMRDFEAQARHHCHRCGIPLRRPGQLAVGGEAVEFSETHAAIARPKAAGRRVDVVEIGCMVQRPERPATEYLPGITPGYQR